MLFRSIALQLIQTVSSIEGKVVVFIDACSSGSAMVKGAKSNINRLVNELSSTQNGAITFTSSTGDEYSIESASWNNGAFTKALLSGFSGSAKVAGKNKITVLSLGSYISEYVSDLTQDKQHPTIVIPPNIPGFTIGVVQ